MLTIRPQTTHRFGAFLLLAVLALGLLLPLSSPAARADLPKLENNGDGSRTVAWWLNSSQGLTLQGIDLANGNATLPWHPHDVTWDAPMKFVANGSLGPNLSVDGPRISLRSDATNHVADGDFARSTAWRFASSPLGNVTATWNATSQSAVFRHASSSTETLWDGLDQLSGSWAGTSSPGASVTPLENTTGSRKEGSGMLEMDLSLPSDAGSYVGAQHIQPVLNWSRYDRMAIWVFGSNVSSPLTFNVTAFVGASLHHTTGFSLVSGWQEVAVDLTELGAARDTLVSLTLRLNGQNVPSTKVFFDDIRVGIAKRFDEAASVAQTYLKAAPTWGVPGSAILRFNWTIPNSTGIVGVTGFANVSGPMGSFRRAFGGPPHPGWMTFFADVSAETNATGAYDVSIALQVVVNNTSTSSVEARVDDVSLVFPNRQNGTYQSSPILLGSRSEFLRVAWACDLSSSTGARMALRSGDSANLLDGTWSGWQGWTSAGTYPLSLTGAAYFQVRVDLTTLNASQTPSLQTMDISTRHHAPSGTIVSGNFTVPSSDSFLRWRSIRAEPEQPLGTSIAFSIGDGDYFQTVPADGNLSGFSSAKVAWTATVATGDGLVTPRVNRVELVYERAVSGPVPWSLASVPLMWYLGALLAAAVAGYVGYEFVIRRMFAIDDLFLISRDGRLLMHNTRRMRADRDPDILSAMLTAILSFLRDSDPEGNGELRRFQIGDKTTILERGVHAYLAAVYSGRVPRWAGKDLSRFMANLESRFGESFARWTGDPEDLQGLREFTGQFVSHFRYRPPRRVTGRAS